MLIRVHWWFWRAVRWAMYPAARGRKPGSNRRGDDVNGFLLLARCGIDDIPIGLFESLEKSRAVAGETSRGDVMDAARAIYGLDTSIVFCLTAVEFRDGRPVNDEEVKDFVCDHDDEND